MSVTIGATIATETKARPAPHIDSSRSEPNENQPTL